jgi:DegV family protein with EDD domain
MNKYAVMVDSGCNLPRALVDKLGMIWISNQVQVGAEMLADDGDATRAAAFYANGFDNGKIHADIVPVAASAYLELVKARAIRECDHLLLLAPLRELSQLYQNAHSGLVSIATSSMDERMKIGRKEIMKIDIEDTRNLFSAHGLTAWEAALAIQAGKSMDEVRKHVAQVSSQAMAYFVANNVKYIYNRARDSKDKPNAMLFAVGSVLDIKPIVVRQGTNSDTVAKVRGFDAAAKRLMERIARLIQERTLTVPRIVVSYSGPLSDLQAVPGFTALEITAQNAGVEIAQSVMSLSCGMFMGSGSLAIGLAAQPHMF